MSTCSALKRIALGGKGEHGRLYNQGVLSVIGQIESKGSFDPDPIKLVAGVQTDLERGAHATTQQEQEQAQEMAQARGWTLKEAVQFAAGVAQAESLLSRYKRKKRVLHSPHLVSSQRDHGPFGTDN